MIGQRPVMVAPAPRHRIFLAAAAIGLALGVFSSLADGVVPWRTFTTLGNIISPWVIVAFAAGRLARSLRAGAWAGTGALVVGVVTYYLIQGIRFAITDGAPSGYLMNATHLVWLIAAFTVGPIVGAAGAACTRPRPPVPAVIAPSIILVAEAGYLLLDRRPWRWHLPQEWYRLADVGVFVVLVVLALALPAMLIPERVRRRRAYAAVVICGTAGAVGIYLLYQLLVALA